jgi:hypothetical protein
MTFASAVQEIDKTKKYRVAGTITTLAWHGSSSGSESADPRFSEHSGLWVIGNVTGHQTLLKKTTRLKPVMRVVFCWGGGLRVSAEPGCPSLTFLADSIGRRGCVRPSKGNIHGAEKIFLIRSNGWTNAVLGGMGCDVGFLHRRNPSPVPRGAV